MIDCVHETQDRPVGSARASGEHAELFLAAMREAHKAWAQTPMLARISQARARQVCSTLAQADAATVAAMIGDMAGPALASYAVRTTMDADKAMRLGLLLTQMFAAACVPQRDQTDATDTNARALALCEAMRARIVQWIDSGTCSASAELERIDALIGHEAAIRLGLLASLAPALAHCDIVARALAQGYPFSGE